MRATRILLILIAVICFGVALSYPIRYRLAQNENNANMDALSDMRDRAMRQTDDEPDPSAEGVLNPEGASGAETDEGSDAETGEGPETEDDWDADATEDEDDVPLMPVRPTRAPEDAPQGRSGDGPDEAAETAEPVGPTEAMEAEATATSDGGAAEPSAPETPAPETPAAEPTEDPGPLENPTLEDLLLDVAFQPKGRG